MWVAQSSAPASPPLANHRWRTQPVGGERGWERLGRDLRLSEVVNHCNSHGRSFLPPPSFSSSSCTSPLSLALPLPSKLSYHPLSITSTLALPQSSLSTSSLSPFHLPSPYSIEQEGGSFISSNGRAFKIDSKLKLWFIKFSQLIYFHTPNADILIFTVL